MVLLIVLLAFISAWYFGLAAFTAGLSVKYWAIVGFILGPLAFPLFTAHSHLALRKIRCQKELMLAF
ncbi:hypothetical protein [Shewanella sp. CG12_big_fil_rev_8_21_14_0_65_47_15]|uniref:hypothetical protein n=1 Tax=Shewanella sp. CG12_big_fil_rev_8_21_14_0_65_47_15 TaxID=1975537 RepID=UPI000CADAECB|nr:hypothetical protein [Shewanella sp. CG12_big_fil_rev_8_21_14_0_65_47_15]PIW60735.1 MAG: hypothetical protein COW15_11390 [Shewanella sp. CG12_big_fil_rev_8_21_14_0_65_47_15]